MLVVRREQALIESIWTRHGAGIERLTLMNAYSIACCYGEIRSHKQTILVEHETTDLTPALERAIADAHDIADWRAADSITPNLRRRDRRGVGMPIPGGAETGFPCPTPSRRKDRRRSC